MTDPMTDPAILKALRALYEAFFDTPGKTAEQFAAIEKACKVLTRYPKPKRTRREQA